MSLAGKRLDDYLGSQHSAVGLLLAWLGLPAFLMGAIFALTVSPVEFPLWGSISLAVWGLVALPLGISMRRQKPSPPIWIFANVWLGAALVTMFSLVLAGKS